MGSQQATTYPTEKQYERWKDRAEEMDMAVSEWIQAMTEAGAKKFDATVEPDETTEELRRERNRLQNQLEEARERIDRLENRKQLERRAIREYVENNDSVTFPKLVEHMMSTVPERVRSHLDLMDIELEYTEQKPGESIIYRFILGEEEDIEEWEDEDWTELKEW